MREYKKRQDSVINNKTGGFKVTESLDAQRAFKASFTSAGVAQGVRPTSPGGFFGIGGGIATGGAGGDAASVGAGFGGNRGGFSSSGITGTGFSGFGSTQGESNNVKLKTVLSNLTATSNALLPHEIKALQAQSNGGGTIIANNDNDNSTTHHHQYGSNGMRTVDTLMAMNGHGGYGVMGLQAATAMGGFSSP